MSAARSNRNHVLKLTACAGPHPALSAPPRLLVQGRHNNPDLGESTGNTSGPQLRCVELCSVVRTWRGVAVGFFRFPGHDLKTSTHP